MHVGPTISADALDPGAGLKLPEGPLGARDRTAQPGPDAEPDTRFVPAAVEGRPLVRHLPGARRDLLTHRRSPLSHLLPDTTAPPQQA